MKKIHMFVLPLGILLFSNVQAELTEMHKPYAPQPEVGKPMPDFTLDNITHYKTTSASLKDFKGKWLFLDFWFAGCVTCIKSFPKVNAIQQKFSDKILYMLVGVNSKLRYHGTGIVGVYEGMRKKMGLQLASAYDSVLADQWGITSMPHIIIVDPGGIVRFITGGSDLTDEKIAQLLDGQPVSFERKDKPVPEYDSDKLSFSENDKILYRSILTKSEGERSTVPDFKRYVKWPVEYRKKGIKVQSASLSSLYTIAYYGEAGNWSVSDAGQGMYFYPDIILEVKDPDIFHYNPKAGNKNNLYSYNLVVPASRTTDLEFIKKTMQQELKHAFGYEASLEKREMPVWKLVAQPGTAGKLKTKGGKTYAGDGTGNGAIPSGFTAVNISSQKFLDLITYYIYTKQPPFFDETGISHNIDIVFSADMTRFDAIRQTLQKNGLDLVKGSKEFIVLVIRDPKN